MYKVQRALRSFMEDKVPKFNPELRKGTSLFSLVMKYVVCIGLNSGKVRHCLV